MTGKEAFEIWAPTGARWTDWVRPVHFIAPGEAATPNFSDTPTAPRVVMNPSIPDIYYISEPQTDAAIILDLPGYEGIKEGLALARLGWRPIPLYNGTNGQPGAMTLVDNQAIDIALVWGAEELSKIELPNDAPPAFLLDSNRTNRHKMNVSVFDNSWDIYEQDMPSAAYFPENGITEIIVRGQSIQRDLRRILYKYQKKGLQIFFTDGYENAKEVSIKKPLLKN